MAIMAAMSLVIIAVAALAAASASAAVNPFVVSTTPSGDFAVSVASWPGFLLQGGEVGVWIDGKWVSSLSGLTPANPTTFSGSDS